MLELKFLIAVIILILFTLMALNHINQKVTDHPFSYVKEFEEEEIDISQRLLLMTATAYTLCEEECDSTPYITATNLNLKGCSIKDCQIVAVSKDAEKFFPMHSVVRLIDDQEILGDFRVEDRMNQKINGLAIDILKPTKLEAKNFGRRRVMVGLL